jgi:hypothetical protein
MSPLEEKMSGDGTWIPEMSKRFPTVKRLDGKTVVREEETKEDDLEKIG